ncbi:MAG: transposase, partial [Halanaerobiales bacterium]|nr:transposase [Halanaerobiales bacterium]
NFNCPNCTFKYHRDSVGAINILKKYTIGTLEGKPDWLEGELTSPFGVRYNSNSISCQTNWNSRPFKSRRISA